MSERKTAEELIEKIKKDLAKAEKKLEGLNVTYSAGDRFRCNGGDYSGSRRDAEGGTGAGIYSWIIDNIGSTDAEALYTLVSKNAEGTGTGGIYCEEWGGLYPAGYCLKISTLTAGMKKGIVFDSIMMEAGIDMGDNNILNASNIESAKAKIGDSENYLDADENGTITLHGEAKVENHYILDPKRFKLPASNFPAESFEGIFYTLDFDASTDKSAYAEEHVPFKWDGITDFNITIDWLHDSADAGKVVWAVEYLSISEGDTVASAGTTITQVSTGTHPENILIKTDFNVSILATNLSIDDDFAMRVFRDADHDGDTLNEDAKLLNMHIHYITNKLGQ